MFSQFFLVGVVVFYGEGGGRERMEGGVRRLEVRQRSGGKEDRKKGEDEGGGDRRKEEVEQGKGMRQRRSFLLGWIWMEFFYLFVFLG